jgi:preprotein translocase subunit SecA
MMLWMHNVKFYKRRRHALFGERLKLDIANMLYDTCELIVKTQKQRIISKLWMTLIRYFSLLLQLVKVISWKFDIELTGKV